MASVLAPGQAVGRMFEEAEATSTFALAPITDALDGSYALLFRTCAAGADVDDAQCHGVDLGYLDRLREAGRERLLPGWLSGLPSGSVFDRAAFGSDQQFARTTFFNHVIRPEGRFHCMIATPWTTKRHRYHLVVGRPRAREEFGAEDRRLLGLLLPHVTGVIRLTAELTQATAAARCAQDALDWWPAPFLLLSAGASPRFANAAAQRWLARGDLIRLDPRGCLALSSVTETVRLRRALAGVARDGGEQMFMPEPATGVAPLRLLLRRAAPVGSRPASDADVGVLIQVDGAEVLAASADRVAALARQHGLTRRETALLQQLVVGDTLLQAARRLGISYNTGRSYLRQIFEKLAVNRQGDLLRLCTTGCRPGHRPP